jgi:hypothetical protein
MYIMQCAWRGDNPFPCPRSLTHSISNLHEAASNHPASVVSVGQQCWRLQMHKALAEGCAVSHGVGPAIRPMLLVPPTPDRPQHRLPLDLREECDRIR